MRSKAKMIEKKHFNKCAGDYDNFHSKPFIWRLYTKHQINKVKKILKRDMRILEIGCGTGNFTIPLAKRGVNIFALDISESMVKIAKEKDLENKISFLIGDAEALPFRNLVFDMVVGSGVLHHLPKLQNSTNEISKMLKPFGKIFFVEPNADSLSDKIFQRHFFSPKPFFVLLLSCLFILITRVFGKKMKPRENLSTSAHRHVHIEEIEKIFENSGIFVDIESSGFVMPLIEGKRLYLPLEIKLAKLAEKLDHLVETVFKWTKKGGTLFIKGKKEA